MKREMPEWYRWVMMTMFCIISFLVAMCQFQPSFFARDIMAAFGVNTQGYSWMTAFPMITGIIIALALGSLTDKFGMRNTMLVSLIVTSVGAIARAYCTSYIVLLLMSSLLGIVATFVTVNMAKLAMLWFPPRQIGLAVGIMSAAGSAGMAVAQAVTGIMFSDFRSAFFWGGISLAIATVLWVILGRDKTSSAVPAVADSGLETVAGSGNSGKPAEKATSKSSGRGGFASAMKCKGVWIAGVGAALYAGFNITAGSLLTTALIVNWATDAVQAGIVTSLFTCGVIVGAIVMPPFVSSKPYAKVLSISLPILAMGLFIIGWNINVLAARCVLFPIAGIFFGGISPIFFSYPSVLPEINNENSGAAGGIITTLMTVGATCFPTLVITPIAGSDYNLLICLGCLCGLLAAIPFALLPSTYRGAKTQGREAVELDRGEK
ncbi:MAG: MFS transporter [Coriobacteriales bacterium]